MDDRWLYWLPLVYLASSIRGLDARVTIIRMVDPVTFEEGEG